MTTTDDGQAAAADRLAKVMARAGLCSRRDAEDWIRAGRVSVNGAKVLTPAFNVGPTDEVVVDGEPLAERQGTRLWLYHKPRGLVVTEKDPEGRPTIFEALESQGLPRVVSVGRLDINTEGLLLLTNDGGLKRVLELPATGWLRKYRVRAHGTITQAQLDALRNGLEGRGRHIRADRCDARARAGQQCLDRSSAARRQEPRDQECPLSARSRRQPADPHQLRSLPARRHRRRRRRAGEGARAARPARRPAGARGRRRLRCPGGRRAG